MPVLNAIASAVRQSIARAVDPDSPRYYPNLTGAQYGTTQGWTAKSARYSLRAKVKISADLTTNARALESADQSFGFYLDGVALNPDRPGIKYKSGGVDTWLTADAAGAITPGVVASIEARLYPDKVELYKDGVLVKTGTAAPDFPQQPITHLSGAGAHWEGVIYDVELIDYTPIQDCHATPGLPASQRNAKLQKVSLPGNFKIGVHFVADTPSSGSNNIFGHELFFKFNHLDTGVLSVLAGNNNWVHQPGGVKVLTPGQHYYAEAVYDRANKVLKSYIDGVLDKQSTGASEIATDFTFSINTATNHSQYYVGPVQAVIIQCGATGKRWHFVNNGGELVENISITDEFGPNVFDQLNLSVYTGTTYAPEVTGSNIRIVGRGTQDRGARLYLDRASETVLEQGAVYRMDWSYVRHSGMGGLQVLTGADGNLNSTASSTTLTTNAPLGRQTTDFVASQSVGFKAAGDDGAEYEVAIHSIRRIYKLATGVKEQIYTPEGAYYASDESNMTTKNADGSFHLKGGFAQLSMLTGAEQGQLYEVTADISVIGGFVAVFTSDGTTAWEQTTDAVFGSAGQRKKTTYRFFAPKTGVIGVASRGSSGEAIVHSLTIDKISAAKWLHGSTGLSAAEVLAARVAMPKISRGYEFSNLPQVIPHASPLQLTKVVMGNGASRHGKTAEISIPGDCDVYGWLKYVGKGSFSNVFAGSTSRFSVTGNTSNTQTIRLDGSMMGGAGDLTGTTVLADGGHYFYKISIRSNVASLYLDGILQGSKATTGPLTIANIGADYASGVGGSDGTMGPLAQVYAHDLASRKLYAFDDRGGDGVLLRNVSVLDRFYGDDFAKYPLSDFTGGVTGLTLTNDGEYLRITNNTGVGKDIYIPEAKTGLKVGDVIKVTVDVRRIVGSVQAVCGYSGPGVGPYLSKPGVYTFELTAYGNANLGFRTYDGEDVEVRYSYAQKVHSKATAEGPEQWDFRGMGTQDANSYVIETGANSFRFDGSGAPAGESSERCYIDFPTIPGRQYSLWYRRTDTGTANSVVLFARDGSHGNGNILKSSAPVVVGESGVLTFTATTASSTILFDGNSISGYAFDDLSLKQNTHAVLHESATQMTVAAANTARSFLPELAKGFLELGHVYTPSDNEGVQRWDDSTVTIFSSAEQTELDTVNGIYRIRTDVGTNATGISCAGAASFTEGDLLVEFDIVEQVSGTLNLMDLVTLISGVGRHRYIVSGAARNDVYIKRQGGITDITVANISVQQTNAVKWTGLTAGNIIEGELA